MVFMVPSQHFWRLGVGFFGFYGTLTVFGSLGQIGGLGPWARGSSKSPQIMVFMVFMVPSQHIGHLGFGFVGIYGTLTAFVHPAFKPLGLPRVKLLQAKSPLIMVFMVFMLPSQHFLASRLWVHWFLWYPHGVEKPSVD